jgi:hypothetical protein
VLALYWRCPLQVPASKIEVSKPSEEEIKKRKKWAAEKVTISLPLYTQ